MLVFALQVTNSIFLLINNIKTITYFFPKSHSSTSRQISHSLDPSAAKKKKKKILAVIKFTRVGTRSLQDTSTKSEIKNYGEDERYVKKTI